MTPPLYTACARAAHVLTADGELLRAGRAALFLVGQTGHPRLGRVLGRRPLIWLVELGYWIVARNRPFFGRFLFRGETPLPMVDGALRPLTDT